MPSFELHGRIPQRRRVVMRSAADAIRHWLRDYGRLPDVVIERRPDGTELEAIPAGICPGCGQVVWDEEDREIVARAAPLEADTYHRRCA